MLGHRGAPFEGDDGDVSVNVDIKDDGGHEGILADVAGIGLVDGIVIGGLDFNTRTKSNISPLASRNEITPVIKYMIQIILMAN